MNKEYFLRHAKAISLTVMIIMIAYRGGILLTEHRWIIGSILLLSLFAVLYWVIYETLGVKK